MMILPKCCIVFLYQISRNAAFLSGPPSLWSVGNKYWPQQNTSPPPGRRGPAFPPVMFVEGNSAKPNQLVTQPFKHDVDAPLLTVSVFIYL